MARGRPRKITGKNHKKDLANFEGKQGDKSSSMEALLTTSSSLKEKWPTVTRSTVSSPEGSHSNSAGSKLIGIAKKPIDTPNQGLQPNCLIGKRGVDHVTSSVIILPQNNNSGKQTEDKETSQVLKEDHAGIQTKNLASLFKANRMAARGMTLNFVAPVIRDGEKIVELNKEGIDKEMKSGN